MTVDPALPGADIVERGLDDLARDRISPEALAVLCASPRLCRLGFVVPRVALSQSAEIELYNLLGHANVPDPYSAYNALLRRVVAFSAAVEARLGRVARTRRDG